MLTILQLTMENQALKIELEDYKARLQRALNMDPKSINYEEINRV